MNVGMVVVTACALSAAVAHATIPTRKLEDSTYSLNWGVELFDTSQCKIVGCEDLEVSGGGPRGLCNNVTEYTFDEIEEIGPDIDLLDGTQTTMLDSEYRDEANRLRDSITFTIRGTNGFPIVPGAALIPPSGSLIPISTIVIGYTDGTLGSILQAPRAGDVVAVHLLVEFDNGDVNSFSYPNTPVGLSQCPGFRNVLNIFDANGFEDEVSAPQLADGQVRVRLSQPVFVPSTNNAAEPEKLTISIEYERARFGNSDADTDVDLADVNSFASQIVADSDLSVTANGSASWINDDNADGRVTIRDFQRLQYAGREGTLAYDAVGLPSFVDIAAESSTQSVFLDDKNDNSGVFEDAADQVLAEYKKWLQDQLKRLLRDILDLFPVPAELKRVIPLLDNPRTIVNVKYFPDLANWAIEFRLPGVRIPGSNGSSFYFLPYAVEPGGARVGIEVWSQGYNQDRVPRYADPNPNPADANEVAQRNALGSITTLGEFFTHVSNGLDIINGIAKAADPCYHADLLDKQSIAFGLFASGTSYDFTECSINMACYTSAIASTVQFAAGSYGALVSYIAGNPNVYILPCIPFTDNAVLDANLRNAIATSLFQLRNDVAATVSSGCALNAPCTTGP